MSWRTWKWSPAAELEFYAHFSEEKGARKIYVRLYADRRAMRQAIGTWCAIAGVSRGVADDCGHFFGYRSLPDRPEIGTMFLNLQDVGAGFVAHECCHAVCYLRDYFMPRNWDEERFCWTLGYLVSAVGKEVWSMAKERKKRKGGCK